MTVLSPKAGKIFALGPGRIGGLDVLLPLVIELERDFKNDVHILYLDQKQYELTKKQVVLWELLKKFDVSYIKNRRGILRFLKFIEIIPFALKVLFSKKSILLYQGSLDENVNRIFSFLNNFSGDSFAYLNCVTTYEENIPRLFGEKLLKCDENKVVVQKRNDKLLAFGESNREYFNLVGYEKIHYLGYPCCYDGFKQELGQLIPKLSDSHLSFLVPGKKVVTVFLNKFFGRWGSQDDEWATQQLKEIFTAIRETLGDAHILVRPHPMVTEERALRLIDGTGIEARLSYLHPVALAQLSEVVINLIMSAACFQVLGSGTPVIDYGELEADRYEIHPEGSAYVKYGVAVARDQGELVNFLLDLQKLREESVATFNRNLDHNKDFTVFSSVFYE
jgi:hypothetical protein